MSINIRLKEEDIEGEKHETGALGIVKLIYKAIKILQKENDDKLEKTKFDLEQKIQLQNDLINQLKKDILSKIDAKLEVVNRKLDPISTEDHIAQIKYRCQDEQVVWKKAQQEFEKEKERFQKENKQRMQSRGNGEWQGKQYDLEGFGCYKAKTGEEYLGVWKEGKRDVQGEVQWNESGEGPEIQKGIQKEEKREGFGQQKWQDGREYYGQWKEGKRNGKGLLLKDGNVLYFGLFIDGSYVESFNC